MLYGINVIEAWGESPIRVSLDGIEYDITDDVIYIGSRNDSIIIDIMKCFNGIYNSDEKNYACIYTQDGIKRLTYDMIKGIKIRYLPSKYKYETLLEDGGVGVIVKIMPYDMTHIDLYKDCVIYVASSALGALKAITYNENYASDNFTDGALDLKTKSIFKYLIRNLVIKDLNIVLYTYIDGLLTNDNTIISSFPYKNYENVFLDCNIIDLAKHKIYKTNIFHNIVREDSLQEINYIDRDGIIRTTKMGFVDEERIVIVPDLIDYKIK